MVITYNYRDQPLVVTTAQAVEGSCNPTNAPETVDVAKVVSRLISLMSFKGQITTTELETLLDYHYKITP